MQIPPLSTRLVHVSLAVLALAACAQTGEVHTGTAALADWRADAPGVRRHIRPSDLPAPAMGNDPEKSIASRVEVVPPPQGALPKVPDGFAVQVFATGFKQPRTLRVAPNGDIFLAESGTGRVILLRESAGDTTAKVEVFAENLERPYGIAFVPPADPRYVYVATANQVVRYPYRSGDVKAASPAEVIIANIPTKRHWTRDLAVSRDGQRLFLAVGSASNLGVGGMPDMTPEQIRQHETTHGRGAAWGEEENRAVVRVFDPEGKSVRNYATGLRNCSGLAMQPGTDNLWCVVNERDHLGPLVTPDYMARVQEGAFYGWPWYYLGDREDPALKGKRPDLKGQVRLPEVLIQAHSSALSAAFYDRDAFPAEYRGDAFVALHGSHSRPDRTGYKVIRVCMKDGQPTGEYEDFMTGFLLDNDRAWGRPAGVAVTRGGALLVSDDANGTIFRVTRK
ncbi:PQQ-dependent sugar dehydrogenase [Noviherbaspirillum sedimenti]|uniref:Sorbosone dehydrogenase family protein n=1 Tax=Noviherbaspirillum sedimenti TaxID=2320865 RepID=A0A3A3G809_9BURK|nr:PQQ-dependent sugar dehydrogenase [Noviherbaspirillum sedimenti]RJG02889.1 sorbosone dehydrogenase family protein [Noviherbaspirillum sedimenti]